MNINQNGIEFEVNKAGGYELPAKLTQMGENDFMLMNAVDIDWNGADLGNNVKINTTGELLNIVKNNRNKLSETGGRNLINNTVPQLIKEETADLRTFIKFQPQSLVTQEVEDFYNYHYDENDITDSVVLNYKTSVNGCAPVQAMFYDEQFISQEAIDALGLKVYEDSNFTKEFPTTFKKMVQGTYAGIYNLIPNKAYYVSNKDEDNLIETSLSTKGCRRLIYIDTTDKVNNKRDLGGLKTANGTIRYNKIIRGTYIDNITELGIQQLKDLGIGAEIDLRYTNEVGEWQGVNDSSISYYNIPFLTFTSFIEDTDEVRETIAQLFYRVYTLLNEGKNIYIHCSGGKDRTGLFSILLEALLGCNRDTIDHDYELSALYPATAFADNTRNNTSSIYNYPSLMAHLNSFKGYSLQEKVANYLLECGITQEQIDVIKSTLIQSESTNVNDFNFVQAKSLESILPVDTSVATAVSKANKAQISATNAESATNQARDYAKAVKDSLEAIEQSEDIDEGIAAQLAEHSGAITDCENAIQDAILKAQGRKDYVPFEDVIKYVEFSSTSGETSVSEARLNASRYLDNLAIPSGTYELWKDGYRNDDRFKGVHFNTSGDLSYINPKENDIPIGFISIYDWGEHMLVYNNYIGSTTKNGDFCLNWYQIAFGVSKARWNGTTWVAVPIDYEETSEDQVIIQPASSGRIYVRRFSNFKWTSWQEYSNNNLKSQLDNIKQLINTKYNQVQDSLTDAIDAVDAKTKIFKDYTYINKPIHVDTTTKTVTLYYGTVMSLPNKNMGISVRQECKIGRPVTSTWTTWLVVAKINEIYKVGTTSCADPELKLIASYSTYKLEDDEYPIALVNFDKGLYEWCGSTQITPIIKNNPLPKAGEKFRILDLGNSYTIDSTIYLNTIVETQGIDVSNMALYYCSRSNANVSDWLSIINGDAVPSGYESTPYSIYKRLGGITQDITTGSFNPVDGNYDNVHILKALKDNTWDLILFHFNSSSTVSISPYNKDLVNLINIFKLYQPQATIGTYLVHSYDDDFSSNTEKNCESRWQLICETTKILRNLGVDVIIPYGTAIQNLRTTNPQNVFNESDQIYEGADGHRNNYTRDNTHLGYGLARYTANCTYYQSLIAPWCGKSILGNTYRPEVTAAELNTTITNPEDCINVNDDNALIAQKCAIMACSDMYSTYDVSTINLQAPDNYPDLSKDINDNPSFTKDLYYNYKLTNGLLTKENGKATTGFIKGTIDYKLLDGYTNVGTYIYDANMKYLGVASSTLSMPIDGYQRLVISKEGTFEDDEEVFEHFNIYPIIPIEAKDSIHLNYYSGERPTEDVITASTYFAGDENTPAFPLGSKYVKIDANKVSTNWVFRFFLEDNDGNCIIVSRAIAKSEVLDNSTWTVTQDIDYTFKGFSIAYRADDTITRPWNETLDVTITPCNYIEEEQESENLDTLKINPNNLTIGKYFNISEGKIVESDKQAMTGFLGVNYYLDLNPKYKIGTVAAFDYNYNYLGSAGSTNTTSKWDDVAYYIVNILRTDGKQILTKEVSVLNPNTGDEELQEVPVVQEDIINSIQSSNKVYDIESGQVRITRDNVYNPINTNYYLLGTNALPGIQLNTEKLTVTIYNLDIRDSATDESVNETLVLRLFYKDSNDNYQFIYGRASLGLNEFDAKQLLLSRNTEDYTWYGVIAYFYNNTKNLNNSIDAVISWDNINNSGSGSGSDVTPVIPTTYKPITNNRLIGAIFYDAWNNIDSDKVGLLSTDEEYSELYNKDNLDFYNHNIYPRSDGFSGGGNTINMKRSQWLFNQSNLQNKEGYDSNPDNYTLNRKIEDNSQRDWNDYVWDNYGETPVRQCSIVDYFSGEGITLKDSQGNDLWPSDTISNKPINSYNNITLGWRNTNTIEQLEAQVEMATEYGVDYWVFHTSFESLVFDDINTINLNKFNIFNRALANYLQASNNHKLRFCIQVGTCPSINHHISGATGPIDETGLNTVTAKDMETICYTIIKFINDNFITKSNYLYLDNAPIITFSSQFLGDVYPYFFKSCNRINAGYIIQKTSSNHDLNVDNPNGLISYSGYPSINAMPSDVSYDANNVTPSIQEYNSLRTNNFNQVKALFTNKYTTEIIPVSSGYDGVNRSSYLVNNKYNTPTFKEFYDALIEAMDYAESSSSKDKSICVYAWNEFCEGGNLMPKQAEVTNNTQTNYTIDGITVTWDKGFDKLAAIREAKKYWLKVSESSPREDSDDSSSSTVVKSNTKLLGALYFNGWQGERPADSYTDNYVFNSIIDDEGYLVGENGRTDYPPVTDSDKKPNSTTYDWVTYVSNHREDGTFDEIPPNDCSFLMYFPEFTYKIHDLAMYNGQPYFNGSTATEELYQTYLSYPSRKPWFGWRSDTNSDTIEKEIDLAASHGIDYFAFCFYFLGSHFNNETHVLNTAQVEAYSGNLALFQFLQAPNSWKMKFSIILIAGKHDYGFDGDLETKQYMYYQCVKYVCDNFINKPNYLYMNGHPVIQVYQGLNGKTDNIEDMKSVMQNMFKLQNAKYLAQGLTRVHTNSDGAWRYQITPNSAGGTSGVREDIEDWCEATNNICNEYLKNLNTSFKIYPITLGVDMWPRANFIKWNSEYNEYQPYTGNNSVTATVPTSNQFNKYKNALVELMTIADNEVGDKNICIYAWNEFGEGGFIPPTEGDLAPNDATEHTITLNGNKYYSYKLDAIKEAKEYWLNSN